MKALLRYHAAEFWAGFTNPMQPIREWVWRRLGYTGPWDCPLPGAASTPSGYIRPFDYRPGAES